MLQAQRNGINDAVDGDSLIDPDIRRRDWVRYYEFAHLGYRPKLPRRTCCNIEATWKLDKKTIK
jgi:hypothetical protein